jgi:aspartate aminotransferase
MEHTVKQFPAERLLVVKPSPSMAAKATVDKLRANGHTIIDFTIGEPDFPTPSHIIDAGILAMQEGHTRYTNSSGTPALRKAITEKLQRENNLTFTSDEIIVGCGAKHIIYNALTATVNKGDEVIIPAPYWVSYPDMVAINEGIPVIIPCSDKTSFKLTADQLRQAITPKTRWVILNTPNNPSGAVYTQEELSALATVLEQHPDVWIMTDEIYEHFVYGNARHYSILNVAPQLRSRCLIVNGLSKSYAFTGWRIGFGAGPQALIKSINLLISQSTTCASAMSQAAAVIALTGPQACIKEAVSMFEARCDRIVALLNAIPHIACSKPDGAFYVFLNVSKLIGLSTPTGKVLASDADVMMFFLEFAGVATIDGTSYGAPGYLRISFATSMEQIEAGCAALDKAIRQCHQETVPQGA